MIYGFSGISFRFSLCLSTLFAIYTWMATNVAKHYKQSPTPSNHEASIVFTTQRMCVLFGVDKSFAHQYIFRVVAYGTGDATFYHRPYVEWPCRVLCNHKLKLP